LEFDFTPVNEVIFDVSDFVGYFDFNPVKEDGEGGCIL
jgi:hypothetical protein